jgi:hypothetical protein
VRYLTAPTANQQSTTANQQSTTANQQLQLDSNTNSKPRDQALLDAANHSSKAPNMADAVAILPGLHGALNRKTAFLLDPPCVSSSWAVVVHHAEFS